MGITVAFSMDGEFLELGLGELQAGVGCPRQPRLLRSLRRNGAWDAMVVDAQGECGILPEPGRED